MPRKPFDSKKKEPHKSNTWTINFTHMESELANKRKDALGMNKSEYVRHAIGKELESAKK
jgi:hypothetical protein